MKLAISRLRKVFPYLPEGAASDMKRDVVVSCLLTVLDIAALMLLALSTSSMLTGSTITIPVIHMTVDSDNYIWLLLIVSLLILLKSSLSLVQQWFATRRFTEFELVLGLRLFDAYIGAPWIDRLARSTSTLVRMADVGVAAVIAGLIMPLIQLPAAVFSTVLILVTLFVLQPLTAAISLVYLGGIALLLAVGLRKRTVEAGRVNQRYSYKVASLMTDMVGALKEITLRNKFDEVAGEVRKNRKHATRARANIQFLGAIPKFIMDAALIGGFLIVGVISYLTTQSLTEAISAIIMFAVTSMRLIPAMVTYQSTVNTLNSNAAQVDAVLRDMRAGDEYIAKKEHLGKDPLKQEPHELRLSNVTFTYPTREDPAVNDVSMSIQMGSRVGIVGESGSGKSTLVDIILGLLVPQSGSIDVDGQSIEDIMIDWRSRVGYVPQDVSLFDGTIAQNVALTWKDELDRDKVIDCLKRAQMWEAVQARPGGLNATIGERGIALSGGQRQRLGIARALYSDPYVLIMDEATSALDTKTESKVTKALAGLRGDVTVISIAHRLSTVKEVDELYYMEDGLVLAHGTFDEVVENVPNFREQATLAGLIATEALKED